MMSSPTVDRSDAQLLAEYARSRSEDAFRQLVRRHVDLVHGSAMRQVRDRHLAEDITQAVFLILSQRASKLDEHTMLAGWLLVTTRNVARNAVRQEWRLKSRERKVAEMQGEESIQEPMPAEAKQIAPHLDNALARLSQTDRQVLLERFFDAKSHREVGDALGISERAAAKRVGRALEKLKGMLESAGVSTTEAALSAVLPALAVKTATPALLASIESNMGGTVSPGVAALAETGGTAMAWSAKLALAAVGILGTVVVGAGVYLGVMQGGADPKASGPATQQAAPAPVVAAPATTPVPTDGRTITLKMVDPQTDQPLAGSEVEVNFGGARQPPVPVGADGTFVITVPPAFNYFRATVRAPDRVPMSLALSNYTFRGDSPPVYVVPMAKGQTIGGTVENEGGEPLANARIRFYHMMDSVDREGRAQIALSSEDIRTDIEGVWRFNNAPEKLDNIQMAIEHPDYPQGAYTPVNPEQLRKQTHVMIVRKSNLRQADGIVFGPDGRPVVGATVTFADDRFQSDKPTATTNVNGKFHVEGIGKYTRSFHVTAKGFGPALQTFDEKSDLSKLEVRLSAPKRLEGVVLRPDGSPVARATVHLESWRGKRALNWQVRTSAKGEFTWDEAPAEEVLFDILHKDGSTVRNVKAIAGTPFRVTLHPPLQITGTVIDAETKQPIPEFRMTSGYRQSKEGQITWQTHNMRPIANGKYEARVSEFTYGGQLRVEADGYLPSVSREINAAEGTLTIDFELKKGSGPTSVLIGLDGKPLVGETVYLVDEKASFHLMENSTNLVNHYQILHCVTDKTGRFTFNPVETSYSLFVDTQHGMAWVSRQEFESAKELKLKKWGRIEGTVRRNTLPSANTKIGADVNLRGKTTSQGNIQRTAMTDSEGRFVIERVPPGSARIYELVPLDDRSTRYRTLGTQVVGEEETVKVNLGGGGRPVTVKIILPAGVKLSSETIHTLNMNASKGARSRFNRFKESEFPENFPDLTREQQQKFYDVMMKSPKYQMLMTEMHKQLPNVQFMPLPDGTARADDVTPGEYTLGVTLHTPWNQTSQRQERLGQATMMFTVPESPMPSEEPFDIGEVKLQPPTALKVGNPTPDVDLFDADGNPMKLADLRGKTVLVHLWTMHEYQLVPAMKSLHAKYGDKLTIVNLVINLKIEWVKRIVAREGMPGLSAMDEETAKGSGIPTSLWQTLGVGGIPTAFLIDGEGKVLAKDLKAENIVDEVAKVLGK